MQSFMSRCKSDRFRHSCMVEEMLTRFVVAQLTSPDQVERPKGGDRRSFWVMADTQSQNAAMTQALESIHPRLTLLCADVRTHGGEPHIAGTSRPLHAHCILSKRNLILTHSLQTKQAWNRGYLQGDIAAREPCNACAISLRHRAGE